MKPRLRFLCFTFLAVVFEISGCKKKDEQPPVISILSPAEGAIFQVYDTVNVSFEVLDETQIESAYAQILNLNLTAATGQKPISGSAGAVSLILEDKLLETGDYWVLVAANDGMNTTLAYQKIRIIGLPKALRSIYAATSSNQETGTIWRIDSLFQQVNLWKNLNQDVLELDVSSKFDQLTLVGVLGNGIKNYKLPGGTVNWVDEAFSAPQVPRFQDVFYYENLVFMSLYDREVRAYTLQGALALTIQTGDYRPEAIYAYGTYLLIEKNLVGDNRHFLDIYNLQSRAFLRQVDFQVDIVSIAQLEGDEVLVFGNDGNQARVFQFDIGVNSYWEPRQLPEGKVYEAVTTQNNSFAFTHDNGLYAYTYSPNYLNQIRTGSGYRGVEFDVDNAVIISSANNVLERTTLTGQPAGTVVLQDSIVSFDLYYTR